jgi:hypothetical protein
MGFIFPGLVILMIEVREDWGGDWQSGIALLLLPPPASLL